MEKKKERRETSHMLLGLEFAFFFMSVWRERTREKMLSMNRKSVCFSVR